MSIENTRKKILDTVKELLVTKGEQATSMSLIAKTSKISVGSIYNLYKSKEELITAAYIDCRNCLLNNNTSTTTLNELSPKEIFYRANSAYLESALAHPSEFKFMTQYHLSPIIDRNVVRIMDFPSAHSDETISYYSQQGVLKDLPVVALDLIPFGIINQIVSAHFAGFIIITDEMKEQILDACGDAMSAHKNL